MPSSLLQSLHTVILNPDIHTGNDVSGILMYMKIMHLSQVLNSKSNYATERMEDLFLDAGINITIGVENMVIRPGMS